MRTLLRHFGSSSAVAHYRLRPRLLAAAGGLATLVLLVGRTRRLEVSGSSMLPTLEPGDRVLAVRGRRGRPGDLVVVADPRQPTRLMVKRVVATRGERVEVRGDNPEDSTDSRHFGTVPQAAVRGRVVYRYHPDDRRGRIARLVP